MSRREGETPGRHGWLRRAPALSIRAKLLVACVLLIGINLSVGVFSQIAQQRIGALGIDIYDRAFLAMSYLRSAQNGLAKFSTGAERLSAQAPRASESPAGRSLVHTLDTLADGTLPEILSDVQVAHDRAMSTEGRAATDALSRQLATVGAALRSHDLEASRREMEKAQAACDTAVEIFAGDGYLYRQDVQRLIDRSFRHTGIAMVTSTAIALAIAIILWGSIVPALRKAVRIARAISAGKLDRAFPTRGSDETAILMRALSDMRDSLVDKIGRIDALAVESQSRAAELSVQNARFEAALDNMHHGLCMVDADNRLIVANHRFAAMFGPPPLGSEATGWPLFPKLVEGFQGGEPTLETLPDGRVIRIASQPVLGGGWVITFEDVTERHRAEAKLHHMSRHDALTGLPNRVLFRERMAEMLEHVPDPPGPTLLYLDLDGFKAVNDTLGHGIGDDLLRGVATRLRQHLDPTETIARLGGDEFAVILRSGEQSIVEQRAHELVEALRQPFELPPHRVTIGASLGIAIRQEGTAPAGADPSAVLLKNADIALYRAKAEGKGTSRTHSDDLDAAVIERRTLEADLGTALERRELMLLYQPIVGASDNRVRGFEALLRWRHPRKGIIAPAAFVPVAEETGLITAIGRWALHAACAEAARWPSEVSVAVNLSPVQFRQGFLAGDVTRALADARLAPQRLELEITESVLLQDNDTVVATLFQLRALGVRIALDDFGTGYSSLSYLRKFPFDKLKIDRSFVHNMDDPDDIAILRAMLGLGKALGVAVVAEGIETPEQADRLRAEGCTELQGFLFGKAGPADAVPAAIRAIEATGPQRGRMAS